MSIISTYKITYQRPEPRIVRSNETAQERQQIEAYKRGRRGGR